MQQIFQKWYYQYGVRRPQNLFTPRIFPLTDIPYDTIIHSLDEGDNHDIDISKAYYKNSKSVYVDIVSKALSLPSGATPRTVNVNVQNLSRPFFLKNRNIKHLQDHYLKSLSKQALLVNNYNYLPLVYKYQANLMQHYFDYRLTHKVMWDTVASMVDKTTRNHFIFLTLPAELPGYSLLNAASVRMSTQMLKVFDSWDKLMILDIWKWLNPKTSSDSLLSILKEDSLAHIDLVINTQDGRSSVLNLGYLSSWVKGNKNLSEFNSTQQFEPLTLQKLFLKYIITLDMLGKAPEEEYVEETSSTEFMPSAAPSTANKDNDSEFESMDLDSQLKSLDDEIASLDKLNSRKLKDKGLRIDSTGDVQQNEIAEGELTETEIEDLVFKSQSSHENLQSFLDEYADYGIISAGEYKKIAKEVSDSEKLKNPYNPKLLLKDSTTVTQADIAIDQEKITIADIPTVLDKTMLESSLISFDEEYIKKVIEKDILAMVSDIQQAGVIIKSHEVEREVSALGGYENHTLELRPVDGAPSTIRFRIPIINEDGSFISASNKYILRRQRIDLPIRQIDPTTVALTSYYGKNFITRGRKKANNSVDWIVSQVTKAGMVDNSYISKVYPGQVFKHTFEAPYIYNALAEHFVGITAGKYSLNFSWKDRLTLVDEGLRVSLEVNGRVLCGMTNKNSPILVDKNNEFFVYAPPETSDIKQTSFWPIGNIYDVLQLPEESAPVDFTEVRIFSKTVSVGVVLSYFIGFRNLLKLIKAKYRIVEGRKQKQLQKSEFAVSFKDVSYIFSRRELLTSLIVGGFLDFAKQIRLYNVEEFNNKDVYMNLLSSKGMSSLYIRELELTDQLFVDSITKSILESMNEPVTFRGLLIKSTEMLTRYHHKAPQDMSEMRIRGYERIPGFIYKELVASVRSYKNRNISGRSKIEMSPYQLYNTIMKDPTKKIPEDINPIQNLKDLEAVTYVGEGGRSKDSMKNKATRAYNTSDIGVISEATVDSTDVGINTYTTANPNFANLRGLTGVNDKVNATRLLSTSACLAPGVEGDDMKRVNFIQVQQSHTIQTEGYHQPVIRTGYESVLASRTSAMFAYTARQDGVVISKTKSGIIVEYKDGTRKGVTLGRTYGTAEGSTYPHDIVSPMQPGEHFKKGAVVGYNTGFFEPDFLDPKTVIYKGSMLVKTVLWESNQTFEDSSSISKDLSSRMSAKTTKIKPITVEFEQNVINVVKPGQAIHPKDLYMIIEDSITSTSNYFDEESLSVLAKLARQAPSCKYEGTVDKIEVFYHGSKEDMSPSIRTLAEASDKAFADTARSSGATVITGQVNSDYRVGGVPLAMDKAELRIYVTVSTGAGVGDKSVFANQLKSVIGEVMENPMYTESGAQIDAVFGYRSVANRIVTSPIIMGTTATILKIVSKKAAEIYKGK